MVYGVRFHSSHHLFDFFFFFFFFFFFLCVCVCVCVCVCFPVEEVESQSIFGSIVSVFEMIK